MTRYTTIARRTDGWWIVQCDQHPGALSQVKRLDQVAEEHREAIAFVAEVPVDEVDVEVCPALPPELADELERTSDLGARRVRPTRRGRGRSEATRGRPQAC